MSDDENSQISLSLEHEFHVQSWLPNETFFSLCGRIHRLSGVVDASVTCQRLFGHRRQGAQHDIPSRLTHFVMRTGGKYGSEEEIIHAHSILPFHFFLKSLELRRSICQSIGEGGVGSAKYQLGLLSSRFRAHHPLKLCPECAIQDRVDFGVCYWRVTHQYPGVWLCNQHQCSLVEADAKANGVGRFLWLLPDDVASYQVASAARVEGRKERLTLLAEISSGIATSELSMTLGAISALYAARAQDLLGSIDMRSGLNRLAQEFCEFMRPLNGMDEFRYFALDEIDFRHYLNRFLSGVRMPAHALHHALIIGFLFGKWDAFLKAVQEAESPQLYADERPLDTEIRCSPGVEIDMEKKQRALAFLREGKRSISALALEVEVDVGTMQAWSAQAGIAVRRRPKSLHIYKRRQVLSALESGADKRVVAKEFGISEQAVTRILRTEVGLHQKWTDARSHLEKMKRREVWSALQIRNSTLSMSELRRLEPALYAWLYRNDRAWLRESSHFAAEAPREYRKQGMWDERDANLSTLLENLILRFFAEDQGRKRVTLQDIYRAMPEIRPMLSQLDKLPRTRKVLADMGKKRMLKKGLFDAAGQPRSLNELLDE